MRRLLAISVLGIIAAVAVPHACEDEEDPGLQGSTAATEDPDMGIVVRHVPARASAPAHVETGGRQAKNGLRVTISTSKAAVTIGSPLIIEVGVTNTSEKPAHLYNVQRGFREACAIRVTPPGGKPLRFSVRRKDGGPTRAADFVTLAPGDSTSGTVNIAPILARMDASAPGKYRIALLFDSPFQGEPFGIRAWNELGYKEVSSNPLEIQLTWPNWRSAEGGTVDLHRQVERLLDAIGPDGAMDPIYRDLLVEMGPDAVVVLEEKLAGCSEAAFDRSLQGWNALYALVSVRKTAVPHLAASPRAGRSANLFLMDLIAEVESPGRDRTIAPILKALAEGRGEPAIHSARLTRHAPRGAPSTLTVHADGRIEMLDPAGDRVVHRIATLRPEDVQPLFAALHTGLFWIQRPLRSTGATKESLLRIEFLRGRRALRKVDVWETEAAAGNRHLGRIHTAFRAVEKQARASIVGTQGQKEK